MKIKRILRKIFGKKNSTPPVIVKPPVVVSPPVTPPPVSGSDLGPSVASKKIKKIAIIIGHGNGDPGAVGKWSAPQKLEYEYNKKVAEIIQREVKSKEIKLFFRGSSGITGVNTKVRLWDDDLSLELHCNSFNGVAHGCEILALSNDKESIKIGQDMAKDFCKRFNRKLRDGDGVKELKKGDRGHYSLALVDDGYPSILCEPFFIDNPSEWLEPEVYAAFLIEWLEII